MREIARRLIRNLTATPFRSLKDVPEGSILVAEALTPADAALLDPARIAGVATEEGGADGHTAIMLRALGIPSVLGCAGLCHDAARGAPAVLDGTEGTIVLWPGEAALERGRDALAAFARERAKLSKLRRLPAVTTDGEAVELQANLEIPAELPLIAQAGAAGHRAAAHRIPVHEPRGPAGRGGAVRGLRPDRRGHGRRPGHHPRARLGRREGHGGGELRHRADAMRGRTRRSACAACGCC